MSASSTDVSICMSERSLAMVKRTGAERLAATVCPTFTSREMMTPSSGERIFVYSRFVSACRRDAWTCNTLASASWTLALLVSRVVSTASSSLRAMSWRFHSSLYRLRFRSLSARLARAFAAEALATARLALDSSSFALSTSGSMRAMSSPFFTCWLKSA
jgi:hypothetical protein